MLGALNACATPATRTIVTDTSCTSFRAISFAIKPPMKPEDATNKYDTDATVAEVMDHNARWDALCTKGK